MTKPCAVKSKPCSPFNRKPQIFSPFPPSNAKLTTAPIKISLDPGATLNFNRGTTPLMRAARTNDVEVMRLLLDAGADPSITLPDGTTMLMLAAGQGLGAPRGDGPRIRVPTEAGAVEAVRLLLDRGVAVNATSNSGNTALHAAVARGDSVVKLLAERGADLNARNKAGLTPLERRVGADRVGDPGELGQVAERLPERDLGSAVARERDAQADLERALAGRVAVLHAEHHCDRRSIMQDPRLRPRPMVASTRMKPLEGYRLRGSPRRRVPRRRHRRQYIHAMDRVAR